MFSLASDRVFSLSSLVPVCALVLAGAMSLGVGRWACGDEPVGNESVHVTRLGSSVGLRSFAPGRWGLVRVSVRNESDAAAVVRATVHWKSAPELRFGRDVWVPGRATRETTIAAHLPRELEPANQVEVVGRVVSGATVADGTSGTHLKQVFPSGATAYLHDGIVDPLANENRSQDLAYEAVLAMLKTRGLPRMVAVPNERLLPATIEGWDPVRQVVVAGRRLKQETGAATALRRWVSEGGRMWIQLDRSDVATVQALFGSSLGLAVVDRVPLTSFEMTQPGIANEDATALRVDEPIEMVRAQVDQGEVLFEVDGWPAAVQFNYGRGTVVLTLLEARGWMRPRGPGDADISTPLQYTDYIALYPMEDLASRIFQPAVEHSVDDDVIANYVTDQIGYQIPGRAVVLSVLGLFCLAILLAGLLLSARHRLEHLALLTAVAGLAATLVLVVLGWTSHGEVPPTLADFQLVAMFPETGDYAARGAVASFQPDQQEADFRGRETRVDPHMQELQGQIRQWLWTGGGHWQWDDTVLPPGVTLMDTESAGALTGPAHAAAQFGPRGLTGSFTAEGLGRKSDANAATPTVNFDDALIVFPNALPLAANLRPDGEFQSGEEDRLTAGQYTNAALLGDVQRRRARLLDHWFREHRGPSDLGGPVLLAWMSGAAPDVVSDRAVERIATRLVTLPLKLDRPAAGTRVTIPSAAIGARSVEGETGQSAVFDNQRERWNYPNVRSRVTRLRFQIPESVLPLQVESARLVVDCHLPSRPLEISVVGEDARKPIGSFTNPSGQVEAEVRDPGWLELDPQGGWTVEIAVGDLLSEVDEMTLATSGWSIRSSRLEITGTTLPVQSEVD